MRRALVAVLAGLAVAALLAGGIILAAEHFGAVDQDIDLGPEGGHD